MRPYYRQNDNDLQLHRRENVTVELRNPAGYKEDPPESQSFCRFEILFYSFESVFSHFTHNLKM